MSVSRHLTCNDPKVSVRIVTTHFNPGGHSLLKETYENWLPSMGELARYIRTYEIGFDGVWDIDDAIKIPGSDKHLMWQKEALLNKGLRETPDETEYFAWVDHDVIFKDPDWLAKAIDILQTKEVDAVHCLDHATMLDPDGYIMKDRHWTPGYAWCSTTAYMKKRNGFSHYAIAGGGDALFVQDYMTRVYQPMINFESMPKPRWTHLDSGVYHLYHGSLRNRNYYGRQKILSRHDYQPNDITLNQDGILEWATDKTEMHEELKSFFAQRGG